MEFQKKSAFHSLFKPKLIGIFYLIFFITSIILGILYIELLGVFILGAILLGVLLLIFFVVMLIQLSKIEIIWDIQTINPEGNTGKVFVVFRPGITDFQERMIDAFLQGLIKNDWAVDITSASSKTPYKIDQYDLLVLGMPTYGGLPHQTILDFLDILGDLNGKRTALIVTAMGSDEARKALENKVRNANGIIAESLTVYNMKENKENPRDICYKAGRNIKA
jgi:flavodoxin